jgi:glutathione synthase/RimK-type ligase-like ATP-grasp enzyme
LSLLILTSKQDLTADYLIVELIDRRLPYFRLNAEELSYASFDFERGSRTSRRITVGECSVDLESIRAVWYRRAVHPVPQASLSRSEQAFVAGELRHIALGMVLDDGARWVNPIERVAVAEHKIYQLRIAEALGFRIPETLVSDNPETLRSFVATQIGGTVSKPIFHGLFVEGTRQAAVYTRRVTPADFGDETYATCPVLVQEEIERVADVRVTLIGSKCFVAEIKTAEGAVDWRVPGVTLQHAVSSIDGETEKRCRAMLEKLGLLYGAFDFIRTAEGELVFLEVNPTGEWAWLEEELGFEMRDAFIQLFYG